MAQKSSDGSQNPTQNNREPFHSVGSRSSRRHLRGPPSRSDVKVAEWRRGGIGRHAKTFSPFFLTSMERILRSNLFIVVYQRHPGATLV